MADTVKMSGDMGEAIRAAAAAEADLTGAGEGPAPGQSVPAAPDDGGKAAKLAELKAENIGLLDLALAMLEPVLPFIRKCYTPEACDKIAQAGAEVEQKYGVSIGDLFAKFKPEIMLAIAVVPPTISAVAMTRELIAARRAAAPKKEPEPAAGKVVPLNPKGGGDGKKEGG